MNDEQRRQLLLKHTRRDAAHFTHDGLYLGDQKWEHGMRIPGVNELISSSLVYWQTLVE